MFVPLITGCNPVFKSHQIPSPVFSRIKYLTDMKEQSNIDQFFSLQ